MNFVLLFTLVFLHTSFGRSLNEAIDQNVTTENSLNPFLRKLSGIFTGSYDHQILNFTAVFGTPNPAHNPNIEISRTNVPRKFQRRLKKDFISKSAFKCWEYTRDMILGRVRFEVVTSPPLDTTSQTEPTLVNIGTTTETPVKPYVTGGRNAAESRYPHVVALGKWSEDDNFDFLCGGSLISPIWILTAAHCTHGSSGGSNVALLGSISLSGEGGEFMAITRTIRHPFYKPPTKYADIALLKLESAVTLSENIYPACLHNEYTNPESMTWVCGWGGKEFGETKTDILQEAEFDFIDNVECAFRHGHSISAPQGIVPSMVCAGAPRNNWEQDTCQGDSGGPLGVFTGTGYEIIGITSFGASCAFPNSPGIYTRVSYYLDWIEEIVWPANS